MDQETILNNQFKKLPPGLQMAISNTDWKKEVVAIAKNNELTPKQTVALYTEVQLIIYQLQSADDFFDNLVREVEVGPKIAGKIFDLVSTQIISRLENEYENKLIGNQSQNISEENKSDSAIQTDEWKRPQLASLPNYSDYEQGKDPYREPIE